MMDEVSDGLDIEMNYTNAGNHVPEAERNNRTIKEHIRAVFHRLPYKKIPKLVLRHLVMECTSKLNLFPVKGGVSPYYSPRAIMSQQPLNFNRHCQMITGAYVQANTKTDISNVAQAINAIYLCLMPNSKQGGHDLMDLNSGRKIQHTVVE